MKNEHNFVAKCTTLIRKYESFLEMAAVEKVGICWNIMGRNTEFQPFNKLSQFRKTKA